VIAGPIASIVISPATPSVPLGTTQQMSAAFLNAFGGVITGNTAAISWSVSPSNLATIDGTGFLAATATGTGTISATYSGVTPSIGATTALTVTGTAASITVSPAAPTLNVLGSTPLTATVRDAQGHVLTGSTLTWQSLNTAVATLSASTGATVTLTGVTAGSATVRVVADAAVQVDVPVTVAGCANPLVISDDFSTDTPGAWTTSFTRDNTGISNAVTYKPSAGNPGGYREMAHNMIGTGSLYVYHLREVEFDPSVAGNTIHHINYHEDQISIASAIGWGFFIEQNGVRHLKSVGTAVFNSPTWQTNAILNMTQADFPNVNFSAGKMKFGFYRANTSTGGIYTTTHGIDNFNVQVCR
jgi:hypothetical protein